MTTTNAFIKNHFGCDLSKGITEENISGLRHQADRKGVTLAGHLYDAVVGLADGIRLDQRLGTDQLKLLLDLTQQSLNITKNSRTLYALNTLNLLHKDYLDLLSGPTAQGVDDEPTVRTLKKSKYHEGFPHAHPKHTLMAYNGQLFERLTSVNDSELHRAIQRYSDIGGIPGLSVGEPEREIQYGISSRVVKTRLGRGGFAVAMLGRCANTDEYIAIKETQVNPRKGLTGPDLIRIQDQLADLVQLFNKGTLSGIIGIHGSGVTTRPAYVQATLTKKPEGISYIETELPEPVAYSFMELGFKDCEKLLDAFLLLRYISEGEVNLTPTVNFIAEHVADAIRSRDPGRFLAMADSVIFNSCIRNVEFNPFTDPNTTRRFINTMAYTMIKAVSQLHEEGLAHNDIKPSNFIVAKQGDKYTVKLIDLESITWIEPNIGRTPHAFTRLYAAPQIASNRRDNHPAKNDAYALGCSILEIKGYTGDYLTQKHNRAFGHDRDQIGNRIKPVMNRREIETLLLVEPRLADIEHVAHLLTHPHIGKRISAKEALQHCVFTQADALMNEVEFSAHLKQLVCLTDYFDAHLRAELFPKHSPKNSALELRISNTVLKRAYDQKEQRYENTTTEAERRNVVSDLASIQRRDKARVAMRQLSQLFNPRYLMKDTTGRELAYKHRPVKR